MEIITTKNGFPNIHGGSTICPFCGDVCFETVGSDTSCAADSVHVSIGFHCMNGCCWELHLVSEEGELHPHCVLRGVHGELRRQDVDEGASDQLAIEV
jgi:hypothetical protein